MSTRTILVAIADSQALVDISQALGAGWMPTSVGTEAEALAQLEKYLFDALLVDFNLGSPDASELLNQALEKRPETTRFLLAYEADLALVAAKVSGAHQILPKPIEFASLKSRIEDGVSPEHSNGRQSGSDPATGPSASPKIPAVYSEALKALDSPEVTNNQVGGIIARDAVLTAEVLRLANSAYLGSPRNITDPVEAVGSLGLETVKALIMALRFLAEHSHLKPGYVSFDKIWQHSTKVALIARDLVLFETKDPTLASQAFVAGLVHDLGKVVLVTNFDDLYGRVHSLARKQPVPLWEVEKEMFGANHGEIGGCLLGMWNLAGSIVEAAALHHEPPLGEHQHLTPLAAVHIANVLEHELGRSDEFRVAPIIDTRFLSELGLLQRLPVWRAAFANGSPADTGPELESAETSQTGARSPELSNTAPTRTANCLPGPITATRSATSGHPRRGHGMSAVPASGRRQRGWVYAGVAAALLLLLALRLGTQPELNEPLPISARTPDEAPVSVSSTPSPEPAAAEAPQDQDTPDMAVTEEAPATNAPTATPAVLPPAPEPTPASAPQATITNVPSPSLAQPEKPLPDFRLNGIIYTVARPSAIVNGHPVYVGDQVNGATVLSIGRADVTLQINGQLKTCVLAKP